MNHITTTDLLEHLKWRYATKQFDPTKTIVPEIRNRTCQLRFEEYVRASGLPYTILRPVFFFFNYTGMRSIVETGMLSQPLSPDTKLQQLSEEDYGEMVADVFDRFTDFANREIRQSRRFANEVASGEGL